MLKAVGFTDEDLAKPIIGVVTTWTETMPCNSNQRELAVFVKEGIRAAGGTPMEFNTIAISDAVTMGTPGMRGSLISREVIADSIELVAGSHAFDGLVCLVACDKTNPAAAMAAGRLDIPTIILYSGTILPGRVGGRKSASVTCSRHSAVITPGRSTRTPSTNSRMPSVPDRAHAEASTRRTRWRPHSNFSGCRRSASTASQPLTRPSPMRRDGRVRSSSGWCVRPSRPVRS